MFAWIRELTGRERKTLIATYGGWPTHLIS